MSSLAGCLMVIFVVAKIIVSVGRTLPDSALTPFVYVWQDVAVVLGFLLFE